ncbi:ABC transporter permease subunit [Akkermansiaceae bacterium]|nr:ABC transporter permease subunit [Akkermansiaceae bacterium]
MKLLSKIKYPLLKLIDISGFKVLDPPVRLAYGEEPKKQINDILKYMFLPIVFIALLLVLWTTFGPKHKTKSGEVPTPSVVAISGKDNWRFYTKEKEKQADYLMSYEDRIEKIAELEALIPVLEAKKLELDKKAAEIEEAAKVSVVLAAKDVVEKYDDLVAKNKKSEEARDAELLALSEKFVAGAVSREEVEVFAKNNLLAEEAESELEKVLKFDRDQALGSYPTKVRTSKMDASRVANELTHISARLGILKTSNKEMKIAKSRELSEKDLSLLEEAKENADAAAVAKYATNAMKDELKAEGLESSKYAPSATIVWQTYRSVVTVFIGFIVAAVVAIPIGIMCGLNRIVMACLTPVISIFRPVSPVVWLLIFQIVVGAFFPDPSNHWLLTPLNSTDSWVPGFVINLGVNPAMIFSACTVAMCSLWPALVNTALGVSAIDKDHLNVAKVLRLGFWSRLFKIIIPSSLPLVFAGLRISLGVGWMVLIAAEALSSSDGLGKFVWDEYQNGSSQSFANIILACFVVGIIGFFLDRFMIILQRLVSFDDGSATA